MSADTEDTGRTAHDGSVRCALCSARAGDPGWCAAASGLLCDACCDRLQEGDPARVVPLIIHTRGRVSVEQAVEACLACPRRALHLVRQAPGAETAHPC